MLSDDDPPPPAPEWAGPGRLAKPALDLWGVEELAAYIAELRAEIARAEADIARKTAHRSAADALFRKP